MDSFGRAAQWLEIYDVESGHPMRSTEFYNAQGAELRALLTPEAEPVGWRDKFFDADCTLHTVSGIVEYILNEIDSFSEVSGELLSDTLGHLRDAVKEVDKYAAMDLAPPSQGEGVPADEMDFWVSDYFLPCFDGISGDDQTHE